MSNDNKTQTTADLFRERGWGVGTKVKRHTFIRVVEHVGSDFVVTREIPGRSLAVWTTTVDGWSLYTPTPPIPTREEWEELWAAFKRFRNNWTCKELARELAVAIDGHAAKLDAPQ